MCFSFTVNGFNSELYQHIFQTFWLHIKIAVSRNAVIMHFGIIFDRMFCHILGLFNTFWSRIKECRNYTSNVQANSWKQQKQDVKACALTGGRLADEIHPGISEILRLVHPMYYIGGTSNNLRPVCLCRGRTSANMRTALNMWCPWKKLITLTFFQFHNLIIRLKASLSSSGRHVSIHLRCSELYSCQIQD